MQNVTRSREDHLLHLAKIADAGHGHQMETFLVNASGGRSGHAFELKPNNSGLNARLFGNEVTVFDEIMDAIKVIPLDNTVQGANDFFRAFSTANQYVVRGAYGEAKAIKEFLEANPGARLEKVSDWVEMKRVSKNELEYYQSVQGVDSVFKVGENKVFVESKVMAGFYPETLLKQFRKHLDTQLGKHVRVGNDSKWGFSSAIGSEPKIVYSLKGSAFSPENASSLRSDFIAECKRHPKIKLVSGFCDRFLNFIVDEKRYPPLVL